MGSGGLGGCGEGGRDAGALCGGLAAGGWALGMCAGRPILSLFGAASALTVVGASGILRGSRRAQGRGSRSLGASVFVPQRWRCERSNEKPG